MAGGLLVVVVVLAATLVLLVVGSTLGWHRGRPHNVHDNWIICGNQLDGVRLVDDEIVKRRGTGHHGTAGPGTFA